MFFNRRKVIQNVQLSTYFLIFATSKRARQIAEGAEVKTKVKEESPVTLAANEIAEGKVEIVEPAEEKEDRIERGEE